MELFRIGISWNMHTVRLAVFRVSGLSSKLFRFVRLPITSAGIASVQEVVRAWSKKHLPDTARVTAVLSLPEGQLFLKELDIPSGTRIEVTQAIKWELINNNATFPKDSVISWMSVPGNAAHRSALVVALREAESGLFQDTLDDVGWFTTAIEPTIVSLRRAFRLPADPLLILGIEGNQASLVIVESQTPKFATLIDLAQSEESGKVGAITQTAATALVSKIRQSIEFWQSKHPATFTQVILLGDAVTSGIGKLLHTSLELVPLVPLTRKDLKLTFGKQTEHALLEYAVSIGAATRLTSFSYDDDMNLLPESSRRTQSIETRKLQMTQAAWQVMFASVMLTLVAAVVWIGSSFLAIKYTRDIAQNKQFIANHPAQKIIPEVQAVNSLTSASIHLIQKQQDTASRLAFFADRTPPTVVYTALKFARNPQNEWVIEGAGSRDSILAFYYKLQNDAKPAKVSMPYSSLQSETDALFTMHILW